MVALAPAALAPATRPAQDTDRGRALYEARCDGCHAGSAFTQVLTTFGPVRTTMLTALVQPAQQVAAR